MRRLFENHSRGSRRLRRSRKNPCHPALEKVRSVQPRSSHRRLKMRIKVRRLKRVGLFRVCMDGEANYEVARVQGFKPPESLRTRGVEITTPDDPSDWVKIVNAAKGQPVAFLENANARN